MHAHTLGRLAVTTATVGFLIGIALLNGGPSSAIGGLCNGRPASHTWLDASGQYGPALLDGTDEDDDIIGSGGPDGPDILLGGTGDDVMISADDERPKWDDGELIRGNNVVDKINAGDDFDVCLFGAGDELSNCEY